MEASDPRNHGRDDQRNNDHFEKIQEQLPYISRERNGAIHKILTPTSISRKVPKNEPGNRGQNQRNKNLPMRFNFHCRRVELPSHNSKKEANLLSTDPIKGQSHNLIDPCYPSDLFCTQILNSS